jgi:hypothetical protein
MKGSSDQGGKGSSKMIIEIALEPMNPRILEPFA